MKNQYFFLQNMQCPIIYLFESNLFILHLSGQFINYFSSKYTKSFN